MIFWLILFCGVVQFAGLLIVGNSFGCDFECLICMGLIGPVF